MRDLMLERARLVERLYEIDRLRGRGAARTPTQGLHAAVWAVLVRGRVTSRDFGALGERLGVSAVQIRNAVCFLKSQGLVRIAHRGSSGRKAALPGGAWIYELITEVEHDEEESGV